MKVVSRSRVLLLAMTALLGSCRSEKVAFPFQPAAPTTAAAPAATLVPTAPAGARAVAPVALEAPAATPPAPLRRPAAAVAWPAASAAQLLLRRPKPETQRAAAKKQLARQRRPTDDEADIFHVVLGSLVIVAGVLLGLLLGGWLGLGVGVGVVVLGYYFLMLGIGGPHAWREVFQEFFNM